MEIKYNRMLTALGRNGTMKQSGVQIYSNGLEIEFVPITSKGESGRSFIQIPRENLDELIQALQKLKV